MAKLFRKKISAVHIVIAGLVVVVVFLLLRLGYGSSLKTQVAPAGSVTVSQSTCINNAKTALTTCTNTANSTYDAILSALNSNTTMSQEEKEVAKAKLDDALLTNLTNCFVQFNKAKTKCNMPTASPSPWWLNAV